MRLLFDQNLSRRLVRDLAPLHLGSSHVADLGLDTATDREIWAYAGEHGYLIVSKDSDFRQLAFLLGPPPKAVWLRVGNCSTAAIVELLNARIVAWSGPPSLAPGLCPDRLSRRWRPLLLRHLRRAPRSWRRRRT